MGKETHTYIHRQPPPPTPHPPPFPPTATRNDNPQRKLAVAGRLLVQQGGQTAGPHVGEGDVAQLPRRGERPVSQQPHDVAALRLDGHGVLPGEAVAPPVGRQVGVRALHAVGASVLGPGPGGGGVGLVPDGPRHRPAPTQLQEAVQVSGHLMTMVMVMIVIVIIVVMMMIVIIIIMMMIVIIIVMMIIVIIIIIIVMMMILFLCLFVSLLNV